MSVFPQIPSRHRSFYCLYCFTFSKMSQNWNHMVVPFSNWLLLLSNMHLGSSMSFCGLIAHFLLSLNNIPLYACTTVYLSIYLLKYILVDFSFWQLSSEHSHVDFYVGISFQINWVNTQEFC